LHELEEGELVGSETVLIYISGGEVRTEDSADVVIWDTLEDGFEAESVDEGLGDSLSEDTVAKNEVVPEL